MQSLVGKYISILGASTSTFDGFSNDSQRHSMLSSHVTYYPKDFLNKRLRFADPDKFMPIVVSDTSVERAPAAAPIPAAEPLPPPDPVQPVWVESVGCTQSMRPNIPINYKDVFGSHSREVYRRGCCAFGWDPAKITCFGHGTIMYAKYATPTDESVWMIAYHKWIPGPRMGDSRWYNVVGREMIHEYWFVDKIPEDILGGLHNDFSKRVTFAKNRHGKYVFLGVFEPLPPEQMFIRGKEVWVKVYRRVHQSYIP